MAFTTWSVLAKKMRDDLASGNWRTKSYDFDGMKKEFVSPEEFYQMLLKIENRASEEEAEASGNETPLRTSLRGMNR